MGEAAAWLSRSPGVTDLIVDLPSVDRYESVKTLAHRVFFGLTEDGEGGPPYADRLITELARAPPDSLETGFYGMSLQVSPFKGTDAAPTRVLLYPLAG